MSDDNLAKYIPHYGDRLAVVAFCLKQQPTDRNADIKNTERKSHFLEMLRSKLYSKNPSPKEMQRVEFAKTFLGNKSAKKKQKRVTIGWMNYNEKDRDFKQVREPRGGGLRHEILDIKTTVEEMQKMAGGWFFPDGMSPYLELKDLQCHIGDISHRMVDKSCTVEELYESCKVKVLKLYLFTKQKENIWTMPMWDKKRQRHLLLLWMIHVQTWKHLRWRLGQLYFPSIITSSRLQL